MTKGRGGFLRHCRFVIGFSFGFRVSGFGFPRTRGTMHYLAPFPIIIGVVGVITGVVWLIAAGSEDDGGPDTGLFYVFGMLYVSVRVMKQLFSEPMSVLPAFAILLGSGALIWLGIAML